MSRTRKIRKADRGSRLDRLDRLHAKRSERDPAYLFGQTMMPAPIKYSRCPVCVGRPHHSPWLDGLWPKPVPVPRTAW